METLSQLAQLIGAIAAAIAAYAAWRAAAAARNTVDATKLAAQASRQAAIAPIVEAIRGRQNAVSAANRELADFVEAHRENFVHVFKQNPKMLATARQAVKEIFIMLAVYVDLGIITKDEIKKTSLASATTADILLGIVERMERTINPHYGQRPF